MSSNVDNDLQPLIDKSLQILHEFKEQAVPSSMPILFFGDLDRYKRSKYPKTITVGLNPSPEEFPKETPFERFPLMQGWEKQRPFDYAKYRKSLCRYFYGKRYDWFDDYEDALRGVGASFSKRDSRNIALHTDLCSPLATSKTWGELDPDTKKNLKETGFPLWEELMGCLKPRLILASIGFKTHLQTLGTDWKTIPVPKSIVARRNCKLHLLQKEFNDHVSYIVHGKSIRGQPFAGLTPREKFQVGRFIRQLVYPN